MTTAQIIFSIYIYSLLAVQMATLWKIFEKAGEDKWKGLIPGYNLYIWLKIMDKPWWWMFFFIIDGINFLMLVVINVELARTFRKFEWKDTLKSIILPHWTFIELAYGDAVYFGQTDWSVEEQRKEREVSDHITLFFTLPVIGHAAAYLLSWGNTKKKKKKAFKGKIKEWGDAILFAIVAASIIRSFIFEPFTIPTPSMEKDLLVGDYLFVSKVSYGAKMPNTPLSIPFFHNYIPVIGTKSYVEWAHRPYRRLPGFGDVERNDVVVFNFPAGDTAIYDPGVEGLMGHTYSQVLKNQAFAIWYHQEKSRNPGLTIDDYEKVKDQYIKQVRDHLKSEFGLIYRPVDKRENYIKRCVAIAGDVLEVKSSVLYIDGKKGKYHEDMQFNYVVDLQGKQLSGQNLEGWKENYDITPGNALSSQIGSEHVELPMTRETYNAFKAYYGDSNIVQVDKPKGTYNSIEAYYDYLRNLQTPLVRQEPPYYPIFPNNPKFNWTEDNFGPLKVPSEGWKVELTEENVIKYRRCIEVHEGQTIKEKDGKYTVNGKSYYKFKMDYYWMMGDNRNESADSRFWGFVPEDHVVGKAVFIWMSIGDGGLFGGGLRFDRMFTLID